MNPYDQAAFGFAQAYQMNMRAADAQRRANQPSTEAFIQDLSSEDTDFDNAPASPVPVAADEQLNGVTDEFDSAESEDGNSSLIRAKRKVSKYLKGRD